MNGPRFDGWAAVAVRAWQANTDAPWRLTRLARLRLERYCDLLDREAGRSGYAIAWLVGEIEDAFEPYVLGGSMALGRRPWDRDAPIDAAPRSLGLFVRLLRRKYRLERGRRRDRRPAARADRVDRLPRRERGEVALGGREAGVPEELLDER